MKRIDDRDIVRKTPIGVVLSPAEIRRIDEVVAAERARKRGRITRSSVIRDLALRALSTT